MSINDSIFASVGRPQAVATAVRISVPGPFNTLVVVHLRDAGLIPGISINSGKLVRTRIAYPSTFVLVGFDQRSPPDFRHSSAGFLSYVASGSDATFTYAIDGLSARFDEVGRYWIDYDAAMQNIREVTAGALSLSSWVLVNEPPPLSGRAQSPSTMSRTLPADSGRFGVPPEVFCRTSGKSKIALAGNDC